MKENGEVSAGQLNKHQTKKILIALENKATAKKVAESGYSFSRTIGAEVILMQVITGPMRYNRPEYTPVIGFPGHNSGLKHQADNSGLKTITQYFLDQSKQNLGDENITTIIGEGDFADEILRETKRLNVDLIVIGSYSETWFEKILHGNVRKIIKRTPVPVYIVPTKNNN
jgi:nucleotide-binding universal stress UspA family protein